MPDQKHCICNCFVCFIVILTGLCFQQTVYQFVTVFISILSLFLSISYAPFDSCFMGFYFYFSTKVSLQASMPALCLSHLCDFNCTYVP